MKCDENQMKISQIPFDTLFFADGRRLSDINLSVPVRYSAQTNAIREKLSGFEERFDGFFFIIRKEEHFLRPALKFVYQYFNL